MKRLLLTLAVVILGLAVLGGCSKDKKKAPSYPACSTTENCTSHNQVCFDGTCVDCAKDKDCGGCKECVKNTCKEIKDCCTSNKDCPTGSFCNMRSSGSGTCKQK